jgi:LysM repeat protein
VKAGDTLFGLARRYGTTVQSLRDVNRMTARQTLLVGRRLTIPS